MYWYFVGLGKVWPTDGMNHSLAWLLDFFVCLSLRTVRCELARASDVSYGNSKSTVTVSADIRARDAPA